MAKFSSVWLLRKRSFRSLTGVDAGAFHKMVKQLRPHWREQVAASKNRAGRPWGIGGLEEHLLVLLILYRCGVTQASHTQTALLVFRQKDKHKTLMPHGHAAMDSRFRGNDVEG
jgi:hypothetical protein